jgi:hypothetical protein
MVVLLFQDKRLRVDNTGDTTVGGKVKNSLG